MNLLNDECKSWWIVSSSSHTKRLKLALEKFSLYDHQRKIVSLAEDKSKLAIPVKYDLHEILNSDGGGLKTLIESSHATIELRYFPLHRNHTLKPRDNLYKCIQELFIRKGLILNDDLNKDLPSHWEKHGDLVLLPEKCFLSEEWKQFGEELWTTTADALGAKRLGKKSVITDNDFRSPRVHLLSGSDGWVSHVDNGITYTYDVTKCMFSSGNITEKIRVGKFDCTGQTVVDLYAGIGYFVLPYLVHAGAGIVYACEWNADAVVALKRNLVLNGVEKKCIILEGDNRKFPHQGIADHVNLGLIPSSEAGWPVACRALNSDIGGWLHIHGNVTSNKTLSGTTEPVNGTTSSRTNDTMNSIPSCNQKLKPEWKEWSKYVINRIMELLLKNNMAQVTTWEVSAHHIEHVKSYAPHIDHLVIDVECRPS